MSGAVKNLKSKEELAVVLGGGAPVILHFWPKWCEASKQMDQVFAHLSTDFPHALFFRETRSDRHGFISFQGSLHVRNETITAIASEFFGNPPLICPNWLFIGDGEQRIAPIRTMLKQKNNLRFLSRILFLQYLTLSSVSKFYKQIAKWGLKQLSNLNVNPPVKSPSQQMPCSENKDGNVRSSVGGHNRSSLLLRRSPR